MLFRKASLSVITAHAGKTSVRCGLLSMSVMFVAFGGQMAAQPFTHDDANVSLLHETFLRTSCLSPLLP